MIDDRKYSTASKALRDWVIMLTTVLISFSGISLALMCIYSLPDSSTRPAVGSLFYLFSALPLISYITMQWRKERTAKNNLGNELSVVSRETISDKIQKWIVTIFALLFTLLSIGVSLICIYSLPDGSVQAQAGVIYLLSGFAVTGTLVFVVWKNQSAADLSE